MILRSFVIIRSFWEKFNLLYQGYQHTPVLAGLRDPIRPLGRPGPGGFGGPGLPSPGSVIMFGTVDAAGFVFSLIPDESSLSSCGN